MVSHIAGAKVWCCLLSRIKQLLKRFWKSVKLKIMVSGLMQSKSTTVTTSSGALAVPLTIRTQYGIKSTLAMMASVLSGALIEKASGGLMTSLVTLKGGLCVSKGPSRRNIGEWRFQAPEESNHKETLENGGFKPQKKHWRMEVSS